MSWRSATPTSGFGITVDYTPTREKKPLTVDEARAILTKGKGEQQGWGGHPLGIAFHDAALRLLDAIEAAFPTAKVEIVTSGHVDDVNGGYGSIAVNVYRT